MSNMFKQCCTRATERNTFGQQRANIFHSQMRQGYHGVLCGACDETHGMVEPDKCSLCSNRGRQRLLLGVLALWYIILAAMLSKGAISVMVDTNYDQKPKVPKEGPPPETMQIVLQEGTGEPKDAKTSYAPHIFKVRCVGLRKKFDTWLTQVIGPCQGPPLYWIPDCMPALKFFDAQKNSNEGWGTAGGGGCMMHLSRNNCLIRA